MVKAYSEELRKKVISSITSGDRKREAAKVFNVGETTIYRWICLHKQGDIKPKKRTSYPRKVDEQKLRDYVAQNPDHTLKQIAEALGLRFQNVSKWLKRLNITRKKDDALQRT
ncbi:IS630 family transposase domain protein [Candidatus Bealeia paramacronuclearis]|uniref:IS630 transposase-related protein n=1 Tax=Candidatus Bealeia paramacronuclearis TaxID=1921001 RepID=UPI002B94F004|nr:IS630 family transposase domain protein [Candidatus Bealeia paramacronuclearis]MEB3702282.1 IS630 family transposase domain protein [Candidatus Bealeia paramacronuclearis]